MDIDEYLNVKLYLVIVSKKSGPTHTTHLMNVLKQKLQKPV